MSYKKINKSNLYINFFIIYIIISCTYLFLIRKQTKDIIYMYPKSYDLIKNINLISLCFIVALLVISFLFVYVIRRNIVEFSDKLITSIDEFIAGNKNQNLELNKDTLICKVQNKFKNMIDIMENKNNRYLEEKDSIKTLISDISHQIKTPIANISIYNETLLNRELDKDKQIYFLNNMRHQVNKLEWLVKSLIKMSRLETGII
ncbi:signal transduction histidine kinase [[Clostridium] sordellii]|nr:histidine kinase dimerization/phospho-acceptor domain-containing protein [Paeniclostridium sordellii]MDU1454011.1 histidine kinase dimerization/phospho-acceptor domain-containing protein [Paeniclostridium sordellii]CEO05135.1 signal transduction histidine kinase [[Clostridium] sordellii] [Paeniclostridium sordellii]